MQWVLGAFAKCDTCGKEWDGQDEVRESCRRHANATGHVVSGEVTRAFEYERGEKKGNLKGEK